MQIPFEYCHYYQDDTSYHPYVAKCQVYKQRSAVSECWVLPWALNHALVWNSILKRASFWKQQSKSAVNRSYREDALIVRFQVTKSSLLLGENREQWG